MNDRRTAAPDTGALIAATNTAMVWPDVLIVAGVLFGAVSWHLTGNRVHWLVMPSAMIAAGLVHAAAILYAIWMSRHMVVEQRSIQRYSSRQGGMQQIADDAPLVDEHMIKGVKT